MGQKAGEEELKNTRFHFTADDNEKRGFTNDNEVQEDVRAAVKDFENMVKKKIPQDRLKRAFGLYHKLDNFAYEIAEKITYEARATGKLNIEKLSAAKEETDRIAGKIGEAVRMEFGSIRDTTKSMEGLFSETGFYHLKGYSLAEVMYENFGAESSFKNYREIFATRGGNVRLKSKILKKLPDEDREKLRMLEEKTAGISDFWFVRENLFHDLQKIANNTES